MYFGRCPMYLLWPCVWYDKKKGWIDGAYLGTKGWIQGHILGEITDLEFGTHGFLMNHVFLPTEQVETNICWIIYQDATFKICLSLFGGKVNILDKMHIVHCRVENPTQTQGLPPMTSTLQVIKVFLIVCSLFILSCLLSCINWPEPHRWRCRITSS